MATRATTEIHQTNAKPAEADLWRDLMTMRLMTKLEQSQPLSRREYRHLQKELAALDCLRFEALGLVLQNRKMKKALDLLAQASS